MAQSAAKVDIWNRALDRIGETQGVQSETEDTPAAGVCRHHYDDILRELLEKRDWPWAIKQVTLVDISDQVTSKDGDGSNKVFVAPPFSDPLTLSVVQTVIATGVETELVAVTDYTIQLPVNIGDGSITTVATPPATDKIVITVTISRVGWEHIYALPADFVKPIGLLVSNVRHNKVPSDTKPEFAIMPNEASDGLILAADLAASDIDGFEYIAMITYIPMMPRHFINALVWRLAVELAYGIRKGENADEYMKNAMNALDVSSAHSQNMNNDGEEAETPSILIRG